MEEGYSLKSEKTYLLLKKKQLDNISDLEEKDVSTTSIKNKTQYCEGMLNLTERPESILCQLRKSKLEI